MFRFGQADGLTSSRIADLRSFARSLSLATPAVATQSTNVVDSDAIETGEEDMRAIESLTRRLTMPNLSDQSPRLTLTQQPATNRLMESLVGSRMPTEPLYDLPSWLEHSYPQFDANPKTPFFSWQVWSRQHLPKDKQRSLLAFHDYMSHDLSRRVILKRTNRELARLWQWQHQRVALGLSPDLSPSEASKAKSEELLQQSQAAAANAPTITNESSDAVLDILSPSSPSPAVAETSSPRAGILGIIHQRELRKKEKDKSKDLVTSHLSPGERSVIEMMRDPTSEVQELAASFINRRKRGAEVMEMSARSSGGQRVKEMLNQELEKRRAMDVLGQDDGSLSGTEAKSHLYAASLKDHQRVKGEKGQVAAEDLRPLNPSEIKKEIVGSSSWMETKLLDRNLGFLANKALDQSTHQMVKNDEALSRNGSAVDMETPFDPIDRPPTPMLDQVQEYLETRYADLLHQKIQAASFSSSCSSHKSVSPVDSSQDIEALNKEAQAAFEAIRGPEALIAESSYAALMTRFHEQDLISSNDLSLCLRAAKIKSKEESSSMHQPISDLLSLLTGRAQPSVVRKLRDEEVDAAKALWEGSVKSYSSWSPKLLLLADEETKQTSIDARGIRHWITEPISFQEASKLWDQVTQQSGLDSNYYPSLAHFILLDQELRQAQAQPKSDKVGDLVHQSRCIFEAHMTKAKDQGHLVSDALSLSWDEVVRRNSNLDLKDLSSFSLGPNVLPCSPSSVLGAHYEAVKHSEHLSDGAETTAPQRLEDLWSHLLKRVTVSVHEREEIKIKTPGRSSQSGSQSISSRAANQMGQDQELGNPAVCFKQTLFLGPELSVVNDSKRVELRVKVQGLKKEAKLTDAGIQLILDVCGEERWDERTQEIVLVCEHYPTREENRRLCFEQLEQLVAEGKRGLAL